MPKRSAISYFHQSFSPNALDEVLFTFCQRHNEKLIE